MRTQSAAKYDLQMINECLERVLKEIGEDEFSTARLLQLERIVRERCPNYVLPGKTVLRKAINDFRTARWEHCAPKKMDRFRHW